MGGCLLGRYQQMLTVHLHDFLNRRQLLRLELKAYILAQYSSEYNFLIHMCISQASAKSVLLLHLVTKTLQDSKPEKAQTPCFGVVGFFPVLAVPVHLENEQTSAYPMTVTMVKESGVKCKLTVVQRNCTSFI